MAESDIEILPNTLLVLTDISFSKRFYAQKCAFAFYYFKSFERDLQVFIVNNYQVNRLQRQKIRKGFKIILQNKQKNKTYNAFLIDFF